MNAYKATERLVHCRNLIQSIEVMQWNIKSILETDKFLVSNLARVLEETKVIAIQEVSNLENILKKINI